MRLLVLAALLLAGTAQAQPVTSTHGWRLVHPQPVADTLRDVHVMEDGRVWIVGDHGTLFRVDREADGLRTTHIPIPQTPTVATLFDDLDASLGGTSPPTAQEFPGSQYMPLALTTIAARGPRDVWIAADTNGLAHWDGTAWSWHKDHTLNAGDVLMFDQAGDLWTWGGFAISFGSIKQQGPRVVQTVGGQTRFVDGTILPNDERIRGVAKQGVDVWAVGFEGTIGKSVGGAKFTLITPPDPERPKEDFWGIWLDEAGDRGVLNARYRIWLKRGDSFVPGPKVDGAVTDVFGVPGDEAVWIVGEHVYRLVGDVLTKVPITGWQPPDSSVFRIDAERIEAVHGRSPDDVWMVGAAGLILHWDGTALREIAPRVTEHDIVGLAWEGSDGWLAASEDGQLLRGTLSAGLQGMTQGPVKDPDSLQRLPSGELLLHALCDDLFVLKPNGAWKQLPEPEGEDCIKHVGGLSSKDLWAAGTNDFVDGKVFRLKGGTWKRVPVPTDRELYSVAVEPDGTAWIGGDRVLLRAPQGKGMAVFRTHEYDEFNGLHAAGPNDVWIAGDSTEIGSAGLLLRWTQGKMTRHEWMTANYLADVTVARDGTVWAVGLGGVGARSVDGGFEPVDTGTGATLRKVYAHPSGALIAIGDDGTILQRDPP